MQALALNLVNVTRKSTSAGRNSFVLNLDLANEQLCIGYSTLDECLSDHGLQALFSDGLVTDYSISCAR